LKTTY